MNFITQEQPDLFPNPIHLFSFPSKKKEKETKRKDLVYQPFAEVGVSTKRCYPKSQRNSLLCKGLEPRLGGGQKYSQNRSKSSNKRKCHEGWSLKTLRVVVVLTTNHVGEYFEGPKRCQNDGLHKLVWKSQLFQSGKGKLSSPSYGSGLKEIWLNPDASYQNG